MSPEEARTLYLGVLREVCPAADFVAIRAGSDVRAACPMGVGRFREMVELLSEEAGFPVHYDDADADSLLTLDGAVDFLVAESARISLLGLDGVGLDRVGLHRVG